MPSETHISNVGTEIRITILDNNDAAIDISNADALSITFKKPDGTTLSKTGSFYTTGVDGIIKCTMASGDLNTIGTWKIQAIITVGANVWYSNFKSFKVHRNL